MRALSTISAGLLAWSMAVSAGAQTIVDKAEHDQIVIKPKGDPDMEAAYRKAQTTLKDFLTLARAPRPTISHMALKVGVHEGNNTEYFWIAPFSERDGHLIGRINNTPRIVHHVKFGETIAFKESDVVDWLYNENGKMVGNFTACALIKHEAPQQIEAFKKQYGLSCGP